MKVIRSVQGMQSYCAKLKAQGEKLGFVPTMGFLHDGHLSLVDKSLNDCSHTAVSIFVNPTQFAPNEDFDSYPRKLDNDIRLLRKKRIGILFIPKAEDIYPEPFLTSVTVDDLTTIGEGAYRPAHFRGVTTVVTKLLNIVQPSVLYLGQKDIQQAIIVRKMTQDLNIPVKIKICPTIREKGGLAMSSRNANLTNGERISALTLITALLTAKNAVKKGETDCSEIAAKMKTDFEHFKDIKPEYIFFFDYNSFKIVEQITDRTIIAIAAHIGSARLIDNIIVSPKKVNKVKRTND